MAYGVVGSADAVGVTPTLEVGVVPTLEPDAGSTFKGGMSIIRLGIHLFCLDVWRSARTPVSERNILQLFLFNCTNWYHMFEHFQEIRGYHDCVVLLGDWLHARVGCKQFVDSVACTVSRPWAVEKYLAVMLHRCANIPCGNVMGLKCVSDGGR